MELPRIYGGGMNRRIKILIFAVCIVLALGITLYPLISNVVGEKYRSIVESRYDKAVEKLNIMELIAEKEEAVLYNRTLLGGTESAFSREALAEAEESYGRLLNVRGDGIMGYIQIPKIGVELPIYHGTAEETLDKGVGHLLGTSLPVGGIGTHCVLTGHSGLAGTRMFSDLDQLNKGDVFYVRVLDETHAAGGHQPTGDRPAAGKCDAGNLYALRRQHPPFAGARRADRGRHGGARGRERRGAGGAGKVHLDAGVLEGRRPGLPRDYSGFGTCADAALCFEQKSC